MTSVAPGRGGGRGAASRPFRSLLSRAASPRLAFRDAGEGPATMMRVSPLPLALAGTLGGHPKTGDPAWLARPGGNPRIHPDTLTRPETIARIRAMKPVVRPALHRWTRREYERLIDHGFVAEDDPIELVGGLLLVKEPQSSPHRTAVLLVAKALEHAFGDGWFVQTQSPIALGGRSEPEPDVCVVRGAPRDYVGAHPTRPALVVEVAQSNLRLARGRKAAIYARARIADSWVVNLADRVVEVHREPARPGPARWHWGYAAVRALGAGAVIAPLAAASATIRVTDLLP